MFFDAVPPPEGYVECPFDKRFLIYKDSLIGSYQLCLPHENDYPSIVGWVKHGDEGKMKDAHNLGWRIQEEYRGQGLMSQLLEMYLQEVTPQGVCFAVVILKHNLASLKMALKNGFEIYDEDAEKLYLKK